jgi:hypothetical protein
MSIGMTTLPAGIMDHLDVSRHVRRRQEPATRFTATLGPLTVWGRPRGGNGEAPYVEDIGAMDADGVSVELTDDEERAAEVAILEALAERAGRDC